MGSQKAADPAACSVGLTPRYLRTRQAEAAKALAAQSAEPQTAAPSPEASDLIRDMRAVDAGTPDLRRRVAEAGKHPRKSSLALTGPAAAGLAIALWQIVSIAHGMPVVLHTTM